VDDLCLSLCQIGDIAPHIIEQNRHILGAYLIEESEFARQRLSRTDIEVVEKVVRAEPDSESHSRLAAMRRELGDLIRETVRMRLLPSSPQKDIGFWSIEVESVAVWREKRHGICAGLPVPWLSVKTFDDTELWFQTFVRCVRTVKGRRKSSAVCYERQPPSVCTSIDSSYGFWISY
jgi:hypothetical protein